MKIHNSIGVRFGPKVLTHIVGVKAYFGTRITNLSLPTPNYGQGDLKKLYTITIKVTVSHKTW